VAEREGDPEEMFVDGVFFIPTSVDPGAPIGRPGRPGTVTMSVTDRDEGSSGPVIGMRR
jgi:hypothetical protein